MSRLADRLSGLDRTARSAERLGGLPGLGTRARGGRWIGVLLFAIVLGMLIAGGAAVLVTRESARFAGLGKRESAPAPAVPAAPAHAPRREDRAVTGQEPPGTPESRGLALARGGALDDAAAAFRRALARDPRRPDVWNNLGVVLIRAGDKDGGLAAFREALALAPTDPEANRNLAVALDRRGELGEARRHYRAFLAAAPPDHPDREEVARRVAALGAGGTDR